MGDILMSDDIVVYIKPVSSEDDRVKKGIFPMPEFLKTKIGKARYLLWIEAEYPHRVAGYKKFVPCCTMGNSSKIARVKW
jgi:hypothetical protein